MSVEPTGREISKVSLLNSIERIKDFFGMEEVGFLLDRFALISIKDIDKSLGAFEKEDFVEFTNACITHETPPSGGWTRSYGRFDYTPNKKMKF